jgi:hypothetical protein
MQAPAPTAFQAQNGPIPPESSASPAVLGCCNEGRPISARRRVNAGACRGKAAENLLAFHYGPMKKPTDVNWALGNIKVTTVASGANSTKQIAPNSSPTTDHDCLVGTDDARRIWKRSFVFEDVLTLGPPMTDERDADHNGLNQPIRPICKWMNPSRELQPYT